MADLIVDWHKEANKSNWYRLSEVNSLSIVGSGG